MTKLPLILGALGVALCTTVPAQNIQGHYVSKVQEDGTIYHLMPSTLFENPQLGDLTYDVTYKTEGKGTAVINFTYFAAQTLPADSVRFEAGRTAMAGKTAKLYIEPEKKTWKHRYSLTTGVAPLYTFFDPSAEPRVVIYSQGKAYEFRAKKSAWKTYAPIGNKIFEMIRVNEKH